MPGYSSVAPASASKSEVIDKQRQRIFSFSFEDWPHTDTPVGRSAANALEVGDRLRRMLLNMPSDRFELDLENQGNPLIAFLRPLMRLAVYGRRRAAALTGKIAEAVGRSFRDFQAS